MSASNNKIALVTGANKGIGFEAVRLLAEQQPSTVIYLGSRTQANGDAAVAKLPEAARKNVRVLLLDCTSESSVQAAVARVKAEAGRLDILINNAGIASLSPDYDVAKATLDTNVYGAKRVIDAFLPIIPEQTGHISIVSSEVGTWSHFVAPAALQQTLEDPNVQWSTIDSLMQQYLAALKDPNHAGLDKFPTDGSYGVSKMFVSTYGRALGRDLKAKGIPVILSCPGFCVTELSEMNAHAPRTAAQGGESVLQVLKRGVSDSGKLFQDDKDQGIKNDMPEAIKQQHKKHAEAQQKK